MEDNFKDFFGETKTLVKSYAEKRLELVKMQTALKTSQALGLFFSLLIIFSIFLFVIVFAGLWFSFWLAEKMDSNAAGFGISTGILALLFILALVLRKAFIQTPVANIVAREIANDDDEEEEEI
jgi:uncharacterized membrane protein (DUF485 family)